MTAVKPCPCGSGLPRQPQHDARGYFLTFTCSKCESRKLGGFRADVLTDPNYWADDLGDESECDL